MAPLWFWAVTEPVFELLIDGVVYRAPAVSGDDGRVWCEMPVSGTLLAIRFAL